MFHIGQTNPQEPHCRTEPLSPQPWPEFYAVESGVQTGGEEAGEGMGQVTSLARRMKAQGEAVK